MKINFSVFCENIRKAIKTKKSQGKFVDDLLHVAGCTFFQGNDIDYQKKLCGGSKPLTKNIRDSFPSSFKKDEVENWFATSIAIDKARQIMTSFGIPFSIAENLKALSAALATQLQLLIESDEIDVDDIVFTEYQKELSVNANGTVSAIRPLYPNDDVWVEATSFYQVSCYEIIPHTWTIHNNGKQTWRNRKLVFVNTKDVRPSANSNEIDIGEVKPSEIIKIATSFDSRGFEGKFDCLWEMQDSDGNNCFPNNTRAFCVTIITKFQA